MNTRRIAIFGVAGGALAAMIAGATTSGPRRALPPAAGPSTAAIELKGAELAAEVARLRERLRPTAEPAQPSRNLFQYGAAATRRADVTPPEPAAVPVTAPAAAPPSLTLVGLASDEGSGGLVRTAIISGFGDLFLVKEGESVGTAYRVARVAAEGVDLTNLADGTTLHLTLK